MHHADVAYQPAAILNITDIYTNTRGIRRTMYHIGYDIRYGLQAARHSATRDMGRSIVVVQHFMTT